jgi:hypothetical protein
MRRLTYGALIALLMMSIWGPPSAHGLDCSWLLDQIIPAKSLRFKSRAELVEMYEALLPTARGLVDVNRDEVVRAHRSIQRIGRYLGSYPRRNRAAIGRSEDADILLHEPIARISSFDLGFNKSYLVEFVNGRKAIFKPFLGQKNLYTPSRQWRFRIAFPREVSAVAIIEDFLKNASSRRQGLSPIALPVTVEALLVYEGQSYGLGSIQMFVEAEASTKEFVEQSGLEPRLRTIDYILGNPDRLSNFGLGIPHYETPNYANILRDSRTGLVSLIDNAFGRPGPREFSLKYAPPAEQIPTDLADAILTFDTVRFRVSHSALLPPEGIEDVIARVRALQAEIQRMRNLRRAR